MLARSFRATVSLSLSSQFTFLVSCLRRAQAPKKGRFNRKKRISRPLSNIVWFFVSVFRRFWSEFFARRSVCFAFATPSLRHFHSVLPFNMLWQTFIFVSCHSTYFYVRIADFFYSHSSSLRVFSCAFFSAQIIISNLCQCSGKLFHTHLYLSPFYCMRTCFFHLRRKYLHNQIHRMNSMNYGMSLTQLPYTFLNPAQIFHIIHIFYLSIYLRWWMSTVLLLARIILSHFTAWISLNSVWWWKFSMCAFFRYSRIFLFV